MAATINAIWNTALLALLHIAAIVILRTHVDCLRNMYTACALYLQYMIIYLNCAYAICILLQYSHTECNICSYRHANSHTLGVRLMQLAPASRSHAKAFKSHAFSQTAASLLFVIKMFILSDA